MDAPGCYERTAGVERKSALQGSGLVRTVGPCAQSRVPRAIATAIPSAHAHGTNGQSYQAGYCLCMNYIYVL